MNVPAKKPLPAEQVEEWLGCRKGVLSQAFSPVPRREVLALHKEVTEADSALKTLSVVRAAGLVLLTPPTLIGLFLSATNTGRAFSDDAAHMMNGLLIAPCLLGISMLAGTKVIQKQHQAHKEARLEEFRAKLPRHMLE